MNNINTTSQHPHLFNNKLPDLPYSSCLAEKTDPIDILAYYIYQSLKRSNIKKPNRNGDK
ncbi:hypothetical protein [Gottfriedia luciferensis]|uniref:hypothetical protein n=1 Tax=Gottfriedia luciferensis TaxID=178774 RepID=UPI000B431FDA|nr:hypothetical protein [Gottfriedia luciferensis]